MLMLFISPSRMVFLSEIQGDVMKMKRSHYIKRFYCHCFDPHQCKPKGRSVRPKLGLEKSRGSKAVVASNAPKEFGSYTLLLDCCSFLEDYSGHKMIYVGDRMFLWVSY
ncbi:uncharacterized protein LOC109134961 [Beta vulgaris subsp. vulgaris]|uniref:uncharacterized protein LOC109134961 n=1 Tax=Beta vulgaris subsp. vulgaris TaxID=3555 RepID=UPI002036BD6E|nr:uncharacterized protein LOC109134961 [Beta vulgaris subsp. vulgaris]